MTKTASELKREALLASQASATVVGTLANEYAGHAIAAMVMPGRVEDDHEKKARALLPQTEALARSLRSYLDAEKSSGAPSYTIAISAAEFSTLLAALMALKAIHAKFGERAIVADLEAFATADPSLAAPIHDPEVIDAFAERMIASTVQQ